MTEESFYKQAMWVARNRGYKANWHYVIFRVRYGKWIHKSFRSLEPEEPTDEFLSWLDEYWKSLRHVKKE